jgi:hypothetical protein
MPKFKALAFSMLLGAISSVAWSQEVVEDVKTKPTSEKNQKNESLREAARGGQTQKPEFTVYATSETKTFDKAKHNGNPTKLTVVKLSNVNLANAKSDPVLLNRQKKSTVHKKTITPKKKGK